MSFILSVVWNGMPAPEEPASPDRERLDAISGALARLIERQKELDQRLLRIEAALGLTAAPSPATAVPALEPEPAAAAPTPPPTRAPQ